MLELNCWHLQFVAQNTFCMNKTSYDQVTRKMTFIFFRSSFKSSNNDCYKILRFCILLLAILHFSKCIVLYCKLPKKVAITIVLLQVAPYLQMGICIPLYTYPYITYHNLFIYLIKLLQTHLPFTAVIFYLKSLLKFF